MSFNSSRECYNSLNAYFWKEESFLLKFIEKGFFYGLILGGSMGFFVIPYKEVESVGDGVTETTYLNLIDYIIHLIRFSIVIAVLGALVGFFLYRKKSLKWSIQAFFLLMIKYIMADDN